MRSSRCTFSTASALHRVFIAPISQTPLQSTHRITSSSSPLRVTTLAPKPFPQQRRYASESKAVKSRLPRDDEIQSWSVILVGEDGKLSEGPRNTMDVLSSIDRKKDSLVMVFPGQPGEPPICKIMNKEAMRAAEKAKAKAGRGSVTEKTIELNWAIDGNDLAHRLVKMKGFLEKGFRVEIVFGAKRKGRKATEEEGELLLKRIKDMVGEVKGAKELKPLDGKILGVATITFEGKQKKEKKVKLSEVSEEKKKVEGGVS